MVCIFGLLKSAPPYRSANNSHVQGTDAVAELVVGIGPVEDTLCYWNLPVQRTESARKPSIPCGAPGNRVLTRLSYRPWQAQNARHTREFY